MELISLFFFSCSDSTTKKTGNFNIFSYVIQNLLIICLLSFMLSPNQSCSKCIYLKEYKTCMTKVWGWDWASLQGALLSHAPKRPGDRAGFAVYSSTRLSTAEGTRSPIVHVMISEVSGWQLVDELPRQEDGLREVFITSRPLPLPLPLLWNGVCTPQHLLLLGQKTTLTSPISQEPGPRSAFPTVNIGLCSHLRALAAECSLWNRTCAGYS